MTEQKIDVLAFGAHPDDIELGAGGTLAGLSRQGKSIGLVDLTAGEMGTRGTLEIRAEEAQKAAIVLGASLRLNLGWPDGFFEYNKAHLTQVVTLLRRYRPDLVILNAPNDRHPDHGRASRIVSDAIFYAGLRKFETEGLEAWRPRAQYHYVQFYTIEPGILVDVSQDFSTKIESIRAHASQFYDPNSKEPETVIASKSFFDSIEGRALDLGKLIGVRYAEAFVCPRTPGVSDLTQLL